MTAYLDTKGNATMRTPMPSPRGTNRAGLFLTNSQGFAYDAAPARLGPRARDAMTRYFCRAGMSDEEIDHFFELCDAEQPADDGAFVDGQWRDDASPEDHVGKDKLPDYGAARLPKNALAGDAALFLGVAMPRRGYP